MLTTDPEFARKVYEAEFKPEPDLFQTLWERQQQSAAAFGRKLWDGKG